MTDRSNFNRLADYFANAPDSHASVAINVPQQRARVVDALRRAGARARPVDFAQEARNLSGVLDYMERTIARQFDPAHVVTLVSLVKDRLEKAALTAEPVADPWVDTRLVRFDDTIVFGHGGFDFDRWESLRWECHTRHGSFAVWKSDSRSWSLYGGKYGVLALDRYSSESQAKAEVEQLILSYDGEIAAPLDVSVGAMREAGKQFVQDVMDKINDATEKLSTEAGDPMHPAAASLLGLAIKAGEFSAALAVANQSDGGVEGHASMLAHDGDCLQAPAASPAGIKPGPSDTAPAEPVPDAWQFRCANGEWTPCGRPSPEELRDAPAKFRRLYLHPPRSVDVEAIARVMARELYSGATFDDCTSGEREAWLKAARSIARMIEGE